MKRIKLLAMGIMLLSLPGLISACATVQPDDKIRAVVRETIFSKPGDTVHLFYGMSKAAKEEFCLDAVVPVYRMGRGYYINKTEIGKIKVTKDLGDHFIEAVVVEGELRPGDIAMQANSECLLTDPASATE